MSKSITSKLKCPPELKGRLEKATWRAVLESYSSNHFNQGDVSLLVNYCRSKAISDRSYEIVLEQGEVVDGPRGPIANPYFKVWKDASAAMASISTKLRISPSSRSRPDESTQSNRRKEAGKSFDPSSDWRNHQTTNMVQ